MKGRGMEARVESFDEEPRGFAESSLLGVLRHRLNEVFEVSKWEELSMTRKSRLYFSSALQPRNSSRLSLSLLSRGLKRAL